MHYVTVFGEEVTPEALRGMLANVSEQCELRFRVIPGLTWDEGETPSPEVPYEGKVVEAPVGLYDLIQMTKLMQLVVTDSQIFLDGKVVAVRHEPGEFMLPKLDLAGLRSMFSGSNKHIYLYTHDVYLQYHMLFPEERPPEFHPTHPKFKLAGRVDLVSGKVVRVE